MMDWIVYHRGGLSFMVSTLEMLKHYQFKAGGYHRCLPEAVLISVIVGHRYTGLPRKERHNWGKI